MHVPVPWVFILAYLVGVGLERVWPLPVSATSAAFAIGVVGWALFWMGAVVAGWCLLIFRSAKTTTVPGQASAALVTHGPYRFSRNPMYVSLMLVYLGETGILKQAWPVALLPLVLTYVNWIVIPVEETKLKVVFGMDYDDYCARVRRWL